ncbi:unnamed protein product [Bursaphelenchus okinawaensis]|uniref:DNA2/NAM7 helicase-like C-terminal domain-containing protein n=1 Tax=Bursaphelenchus okinawaensis TaxID=465554 RepID=A0A811JRD7_9BILA|nr:unnamed protein product [Bursaphelenchus okinawaensis]CAG9078798.1 unnamed protein product [Bursaphelenchus okinawaensis]
MRITVSSLKTFQGKEADIVIIVTVKGSESPSSNFAFQQNRITTALTRGRQLLVVIGDRQTISNNSPELSRLLWYSRR